MRNKISQNKQLLTVSRHANRNALLEATFLALVSRHPVNDAFALVLTGVGGVQVLLDGPPEEPLQADGANVSDPQQEAKAGANGLQWLYLATFARNAAIVVAGGFVPTHNT